MTYKEMLNRRLRLYLECEEKILINQSYQIGDKVYTRADLEQVRKAIEGLLEAGAEIDGESIELSKPKRVVFID